MNNTPKTPLRNMPSMNLNHISSVLRQTAGIRTTKFVMPSIQENKIENPQPKETSPDIFDTLEEYEKMDRANTKAKSPKFYSIHHENYEKFVKDLETKIQVLNPEKQRNKPFQSPQKSKQMTLCEIDSKLCSDIKNTSGITEDSEDGSEIVKNLDQWQIARDSIRDMELPTDILMKKDQQIKVVPKANVPVELRSPKMKPDSRIIAKLSALNEKMSPLFRPAPFTKNFIPPEGLILNKSPVAKPEAKIALVEETVTNPNKSLPKSIKDMSTITESMSKIFKQRLVKSPTNPESLKNDLFSDSKTMPLVEPTSPTLKSRNFSKLQLSSDILNLDVPHNQSVQKTELSPFPETRSPELSPHQKNLNKYTFMTELSPITKSRSRLPSIGDSAETFEALKVSKFNSLDEMLSSDSHKQGLNGLHSPEKELIEKQEGSDSSLKGTSTADTILLDGSGADTPQKSTPKPTPPRKSLKRIPIEALGIAKNPKPSSLPTLVNQNLKKFTEMDLKIKIPEEAWTIPSRKTTKVILAPIKQLFRLEC